MTTDTANKGGKTVTAIVATPTQDALPRRFADFGTLGEALDYAASGNRSPTPIRNSAPTPVRWPIA
jgi:fatty-acyl-CoA synthase